MEILEIPLMNKDSLDTTLNYFLHERDAWESRDILLFPSDMTINSQINYSALYEKIIPRSEVLSAIRKYTVKGAYGSYKAVNSWYQKNYPKDKYPQIPQSLFIKDLLRNNSTYLVKQNK